MCSSGRFAFVPAALENEPRAGITPDKVLVGIICVGMAAVVWLPSGRREKDKLNEQEDQVQACKVWRVAVEQRADWKERCEAVGFGFHSADGIRWSPDWMGSFGVQDPYWCEGAAYIFSEEARDELEKATWELHNMCLQAVDAVVRDEELMQLFEIPVGMREAVRRSWAARQPDLIGRFDILYDGEEPPKLLEYNADTPTLLVESGAAQEQWKSDRVRGGELRLKAEERRPMKDSMKNFSQFNDIEATLQSAWPAFLERSAQAMGVPSKPEVVFAAQRASAEEQCNVDYLAASARKAGVSAVTAEISDLHPAGPEHGGGPGVVLKGRGEGGRRVAALWKLYPYEWLAKEDLGEALEWEVLCGGEPGTVWAEPPWKLILANKSILAQLWKMFPDHPNLLPAFFTAAEAEAYERPRRPPGEEWGWVSKPRFGREGVGVRYSFGTSSLQEFDRSVRQELEQLEATGAPYDPQLLKQLDNAGAQRNAVDGGLMSQRLQEVVKQGLAGMRADLPFPPLGGPVFQLFQDTETFHGRRPVVGSWVIHGNPAGICVREDIQRTTNNDSCFTPHLVDQSGQSTLTVKAGPDAPVDLSGVYTLRGQLRGAGVYYCAAIQMYLLRNDEDAWMFTPHEAGGVAGVLGTAVASQSEGLARPASIPSASWRFLHHGGLLEKPIWISAGPASSHGVQRTLSAEQAQLRRELYGSPGGQEVEGHHRAYGTSHGRGAYGWGGSPGSTYGTGGGGAGGGAGGGGAGSGAHGRPSSSSFSSSPGRSDAVDPEKEKAEKSRHGRKSSGQAWKSYGRLPTGSLGRGAGNMGGAS